MSKALNLPKKTNEVLARRVAKGLPVLAPILASLALAGCFGAVKENTRTPFDGGADKVDDQTSYQNTSVLSEPPEAIGSDARRVALVIGNSDYGEGIGRLSNPTNDALDMAGALQRKGFEVQLLTDVGREDMQRAVLEFDRNLRDSDVGLFYYAGHAVQVNGRNFMIPTGANLDITSNREDAIADYVALETVEIENVLGRMGNAETDLSIVILDACRNNPFSQGARSLSRGLAQTSAPRGTFVAYATAPGKIAQDGVGANSPYTSAIVKALEVPGLKLEEVFKKVRQDVALQTDGKQIPWENSSVFGDFYFTDPVAVTPPKPTLTKDEVTEVQRLLTRMGFYRGSLTGVSDEKTRAAVVQWQTLHGLELDGEVVKAQIPFLRTDAVRVETNVKAKASFDKPFEAPANPGFTDEQAEESLPYEGEARSTFPNAPVEAEKLPDEPVNAKLVDEPIEPTSPEVNNQPQPTIDDPIEAEATEDDDWFKRKPYKRPAKVVKPAEPAEEALPEEPADKWTDFVIPPPPA